MCFISSDLKCYMGAWPLVLARWLFSFSFVLSKVLLFTKKKRSYGILLEKQIDILQGTSIKVSKDFNFGNFFISLKFSKTNGNKHQVIQKGGLHKTTKLHQLYHFQFKASIFFRPHKKKIMQMYKSVASHGYQQQLSWQINYSWAQNSTSENKEHQCHDMNTYSFKNTCHEYQHFTNSMTWCS